jgi:hypothetical protein
MSDTKRCPECGFQMELQPSVYPTWHCGWCGTQERGSEEDHAARVPKLWTLIKDNAGRCLRDDRAMCGIYSVARDAAELDRRAVDGVSMSD